MLPSINIIGAGHLGKTIGRLLVKNKVATLTSIYNRSKESTLAAIQFMGQGTYRATIHEIEPADFTLITTPDEAIEKVCEDLSKSCAINPGNIVLHCSGALSSEVLMPAKKKGAYIASLHPMRSFAEPFLSAEEYPGTYCAIEGDAEAILKVRPLFQALGSIVYEIGEKKKALYHVAGVFASNYMLTLAEQARLLLKEAGVEEELALPVITNLMQGTLTNLKKTGSPKDSLTGPIKRGELSTLTKHVEALTRQEQKALYALLGKATLPLTSHSEEKKEKLEAVFARFTL